MLTQRDRLFLERRKKLVSWANTVMLVMLLAIFAVFVWMVAKSPHFANPFYVVELLKKGGMERAVMEMATLLLPIVVVILFVTIAIFISLGFVIFSNEKRYLSILESLLREDDGKTNYS